MKFVFTKTEVANALSMSNAEFDTHRPTIEANDFPKPIPGLHERWSIIDVINWINRSTSTIASKNQIARFQQGNLLN